MYYNCYFLLITFSLCLQFNFIYIVIAETSESYLFSKTSLLKLKSALEQPVLTTWSYNDQYTEIADLLITPNETDKALLYDGQSSEWGIARQLLKALEGEDVNLYIFGESVSVGADLGKNSEKYIYHYALANWWNETIGKVTNSFMLRRNIAVGGVGTNYFSKCWKEYVADDESFDMALWEFNINDFIDQKLEENIEIFTRSIYKRYNATDLMFAIFYRNSWFKEDAMKKRSNIAKKTHKRVPKLGRKYKEILKNGYSHNQKDGIKDFTTYTDRDYKDVKNNNITNEWQNMSAKWHNKLGFRNDIAVRTYNISGKLNGYSENQTDGIKDFTTYTDRDYKDVKNNNITNKWQNMSAKWHNKLGFRNDIAVRTYNISGKLNGHSENQKDGIKDFTTYTDRDYKDVKNNNITNKWQNMSAKWHNKLGFRNDIAVRTYNISGKLNGYSENQKDGIKDFTTYTDRDYKDVKNNNITNKWQNMSAKWHNKLGFRNDIAVRTYNISGKLNGHSDNQNDDIKDFTTYIDRDYKDVKNNNITNKWQNMSAKWHNKLGFRNDIAVRTYNISGKWKNMSHKWHDQMGVKIWHDQQSIIQDKTKTEGKDANNHKRHDISENIVLRNAKRYNLSCFNIEAYLNSTKLPPTQNDLFIKIHPSILAHAQMALSIISYYRRVMLNYINSWLDKNQPTYTISTISNLPPPIFIKSDNFNTLCWNAVITNKLDPSRLKHLIFDLPHNETKDYIKVLAPIPSIEQRTDNTGGYKTTKPGGHLSVSFDVPLHEGVETCDVSVGLRYEKKDSLTVVTLFDNSMTQIKSKVVDAIQKKDQLYIIFISSAKPGKHILKLTSLKGGVLLGSILVC